MTIEVRLSKDEYGELLATDKKLAEEYTDDPKSEGNYILSGAAGWESPDDIGGLKSALGKERENVTTERQEKAKLKETLEQLTAAAESGQQQADGDLQKQFNDLQAQFVALTDTLGQERSQRAIVEAVQAGRGNIALTEYLQRRVKTDPDTGRPHAVDPDTAQALLDAEGTPMTVGMYVKELRRLSDTPEGQELGALFIGARSSGGGTPPGSGAHGGGAGGGKMPGSTKRSRMNPRQKVEFIKEFGDAEYQKLPF